MKEFNDFIQHFTNEKINPVWINKKAYLLSTELEEFKNKTYEQIESAGIYLGILKGKNFNPSLALLEIIAKHSEKKAYLSKEGEWLFCCGRDLFKSAITKEPTKSKTFDLLLIQNQKDENLGFGKIINKDNIYIKNILDRGDFLRREMKKR